MKYTAAPTICSTVGKGAKKWALAGVISAPPASGMALRRSSAATSHVAEGGFGGALVF